MNIQESVNDTHTEPRTWFTSDTHLGHKNIIKYCDRPFDDTDQMDEVIIARWNSVVDVEDTVYHLGDIALGPIEKSLAKVSRLNGYKIAVLGNHDRPFMRQGKPDAIDWWHKYLEVFDDVWPWEGGQVKIQEKIFQVSHFPFVGDSHDGDRYKDVRPVDEGIPLIHGHTHTKDTLTFSPRGTPQIHVGVDAWGFVPVPADEIIRLVDTGAVGVVD